MRDAGRRALSVVVGQKALVVTTVSNSDNQTNEQSKIMLFSPSRDEKIIAEVDKVQTWLDEYYGKYSD